jgi:hypothetical protein
MRAALTVAGVILGLALTGISATLAFLFCHSLGGTPTESLGYGSAAAIMDLLKTLAPFFAAWHWRKRQWTGVGAAVLLWTVGVTLSVTSAMGLAAQNRLGKSADHATRHAQYQETQEQLQATQYKLAALPAARPLGEVDAALQAALSKPIPVGKRVRTVAMHTDHCARPDRGTAEACREIGTLKTEFARASERSSLEAEIRRLRERIDSLRKGGGGEGDEADRQASIIARTLHAVAGLTTTVPAVQLALIALIALAIEVGGTCSLYAALGSHSDTPHARTEEHASQQPAQPQSARTADYCAARLTRQDGSRLSMREIYRDYEAWCREQGLSPVDKGEFMRELRREGQGRGWSIAGGVIHHVEFNQACRQDDVGQG